MQKDESENLKIYSYFAFFIFLILSIYIFKLAGSEILNSTVPFDTDEADHANSALQLYQSFINFKAAEIWHAVTRQAFYPPLYSFLVAASYFFLSPDFVSSRLPALLCFIIYAVLLFSCVTLFFKKFPAYQKNSALLGSLAGILAVTSPITIFNSTLCMLELPGVLTVTVCIFFFIAFEKREKNSLNLIAGLCALLVFFVKYNFGIISIPAVCAALFFRPNQTLKERFTSSLSCLAFIISGLLIWILITDRGAFFHFFVGHKSYVSMFSYENIFYELNSWLHSYCINTFLAAVVLILAIIGGINFRADTAVLFAGFNTVFSFIVLFLSTTNEERHFMVALPGIIFLSALGAAYICLKFFKKSNQLILTCFCILPFLLFMTKREELHNELNSQFEGKPEYLSLFEFIYNNTGSNHPVLFYGISDDFSIETLRWYFAMSSKKLYSNVLLDAYPYRDDKNFTAKKRMRNLDKPYTDKTFPKKPLAKIISANYYGYAVYIKNLEKKQRFEEEGNEFKELLQNYKINSITSAGRSPPTQL